MKKISMPLRLVIPIILIIVVFSIIIVSNPNSAGDTNLTANTTPNEEKGADNASQAEKAAFILPHPDDETIGAGGTIQRIMENGTPVYCELMTSGDAITSKLLTVNNYYKIDIPSNSSADYKKKLIREDSFKRVMAIYGCQYKVEGYDDGTLNSDIVFTTMENLYLKEGCNIFYTTTGDGNGDHLACSQGMQKMKEKYPNLKYRQFPIYYYHAIRETPQPLSKNNYADVNVNIYASKKKSAFQVYYNINTILPIFYPYSDGLYSIGPERIYFIN